MVLFCPIKPLTGILVYAILQVMRLFREGGYNTLVSTCVGEEGLDIGDVDLIICFDAHKSPIRLVQRMGRTGRKRKGRIIMLVTAGKEEQVMDCSFADITSFSEKFSYVAKIILWFIVIFVHT